MLVPAARSPGPVPRLLLVFLVSTGILTFALFPRLQTKLGLFDYGRWFLDTYAILASNDAVAAGLDPYLPNPLDDFHRSHSYSRWWFGMGRIGLTRSDNFSVGGLTVLAFLVAALAGLKPRNLWEAAAQAALLLSPPFLLAIMRANNDLVVFVVLALGLWAARSPAPWRLAAGLAAVVLATGLKFYPAVVLSGLVLVRPRRRFAWSVAIAIAVIALVVADVWADFGHAVIPAPTGIYSFGAQLLLQGFGLMSLGARVGGAVCALLAGFWLRRRGLTPMPSALGSDFPSQLRFIVAATLLVACFFAGLSYAYRWVFAIWLVPFWWTEAAARTAGPARLGARLGLILLLIAVWSDGLFCLVVNLLFGVLPLAQLESLQLCWRLASQPLTWLLMCLLTGALLDSLFNAWRDFRSESVPGSQAGLSARL